MAFRLIISKGCFAAYRCVILYNLHGAQQSRSTLRGNPGGLWICMLGKWKKGGGGRDYMMVWWWGCTGWLLGQSCGEKALSCRRTGIRVHKHQDLCDDRGTHLLEQKEPVTNLTPQIYCSFENQLQRKPGVCCCTICWPVLHPRYFIKRQTRMSQGG